MRPCYSFNVRQIARLTCRLRHCPLSARNYIIVFGSGALNKWPYMVTHSTPPPDSIELYNYCWRIVSRLGLVLWPPLLRKFSIFVRFFFDFAIFGKMAVSYLAKEWEITNRLNTRSLPKIPTEFTTCRNLKLLSLHWTFKPCKLFDLDESHWNKNLLKSEIDYYAQFSKISEPILFHTMCLFRKNIIISLFLFSISVTAKRDFW